MQVIYKLRILLFLSFMTLLSYSGTCQSLQKKDDLPPIVVTSKTDGLWYDFHQRRVNNLNKKFKLFQAQEDALLEAWKLNQQISEAKIQSDLNILTLQKEKDNIQTKFNSQTFYIQSLESKLKECSSNLNSQESYSLLLEQSYKRAKREKWIIGGGAAASIILYFIAKNN